MFSHKLLILAFDIVIIPGITAVRVKRQGQFSFSSPSFTFCASSQLVGQVSIIGTPVGTVQYSLPNLNPNTPLTINPSNGQLFYSSNAPPPSLTFTVQAMDMSGATRTASVTVQDPNRCSSPTTSAPSSAIAFTQSTYSFQVSDCSIGTILGQVTASYVGGQLIYRPATASIPNINLNPYSGQLYVVGPISGSQTFEVYAYTISNNVSPAVATVTVSGNCIRPPATTEPPITQTPSQSGPVFSNQVYRFAPQNCAAGTKVGQAFTTPRSMIVAENPVGMFTVEGSTGNVISNGAAAGTYVIQIRAWTVNMSPTQSTATIQITCPVSAAEPPLILGRSEYQLTAHNCGTGTLLGSVFVMNPTASLRYAMIGTSSALRVDPLSGVIIAKSPLTSNTTYRFQVTATNNGNTPQSSRVTISTPSSCPNAAPSGNTPRLLDY